MKVIAHGSFVKRVNEEGAICWIVDTNDPEWFDKAKAANEEYENSDRIRVRGAERKADIDDPES